HANPGVRIHLSRDTPPGLLTFYYDQMSPEEKYTEQWRPWKQFKDRETACLRLASPTQAFAPQMAVGGYARPWGGPQMWVSAPLGEDPEPRLELTWEHGVDVGEIAVIFDDDLDEDLINLHHHRTPHDVLPTLLRDYRSEVDDARGPRHDVSEVADNRMRHRRHQVQGPAPGGGDGASGCPPPRTRRAAGPAHRPPRCGSRATGWAARRAACGGGAD